MSTEKLLPDGWIAKASKTYPDKVFYYNFCTGVSTWKYPQFENYYLDTDSRENSGKYKRDSDTAFVDDTDDQENFDKKLCINFSAGNSDIDQNELEILTSPNEISFETPLQSKIPTAIVNPIVKKKKKKRKKKAKDISKALTANSPLHKDTNVNGFEINTKELSSNFLGSEKVNKLISGLPNECRPRNVHSRSDSIEIVETRLISDTPNGDEHIFESSADYYIVVDTNVFMHEIDLIDEIKDTPIFNTGPPHIFIPWIVLQELDSLRNKNSATSNTFRLAQKGVKYINEMIKSKHPRFRGQSPKEVKDWAKAYSRNNDDRILECCLSLAEKMSPERVILLTNDVNLINKAMIAEINSYDIKSFKDFMTNWSGRIETTRNRQFKGSPNRNFFEQHQRIQELNEITSKAMQLFKEPLYSFFRAEMTDAYGAAWNNNNLELDDVKGILKATLKYWRVVFSFHFSHKFKKKFEFLLDTVTHPQRLVGEKKECSTFVRCIEEIFSSIKVRWPSIETPVEAIKKLQFEIQQIPDVCKNYKVEIKNQPFEDEAVLNVFEHNWVAMNNLSGLIMDFYHITHAFPYDKPSAFPSEPELERLICNLFPMVMLLKRYMSKIFEVNLKSNPLEVKVYKNLYLALKTFAPSLNIEIQPPCLDFFNVAVLKNYCEAPLNQAKLSIGYKQLEYFATKLEEAVNVMIAAKKARNSIKMDCE